MRLPNKVKLIIILTIVLLILIIVRLSAPKPVLPPAPLPSGATGPTRPPQGPIEPFIRRVIPPQFLPQTPAPSTIVSLSPQPQATQVGLLEPIKITLSQKVDPAATSLIVSPQLSLANPVATNEAEIVFDHPEPLAFQTTYQVTFLIEDKPQISWSFTTQPSQYDQGLFEEIQKFNQENYPLLDFVPYETSRVLVNYIGSNKLKVTLKTGTRATAETEVLNWLRSHGVDPGSQTIEWVTK